MTSRLSDFAAPRVQRDLPPWPVEGTVVTAPASSLGFVHVRIDAAPRQKHGPFPWVSNGRLPVVGDGCLLIHGTGEAWVLVSATGDIITD